MRPIEIWFLVAAIGLVMAIVYGGVQAEPLKINPRDCPVYAHDGWTAATMREVGKTKEAVVAYWEERRRNYTAAQWPHVMALIELAFSMPLPAAEFYTFLLDECIKQDGWLGREA